MSGLMVMNLVVMSFNEFRVYGVWFGLNDRRRIRKNRAQIHDQ